MRTLVPKLVGATERAQTAKSVEAPSEPITERAWLADLADRHGQNVLKGAERVIAWFRDNGFDLEMTKSQDSLCTRVIRADGKPTWPFFVRRSSGRLDTSLSNLIYVPAYKADEARQELLNRIQSLPADAVKSTAKLTGWPSISLERLLGEDVWEPFQSLALDVKAAIEQGADVQ
jgi:hypothetical protein